MAKKINRVLPLLRYGLPLLLTLLWIGFIFSNSLKNGVESGNQSRLLWNMVNGIVRTLGWNVSISEGALRTLAHFGEFAILALLYCIDLCAFGILPWKNKLHISLLRILSAVPFGFFFAAIDECLQLFSDGRAFQFSDMLVDTAGAATAALGFFLLFWILRTLVQKRKSSP